MHLLAVAHFNNKFATKRLLKIQRISNAWLHYIVKYHCQFCTKIAVYWNCWRMS